MSKPTFEQLPNAVEQMFHKLTVMEALLQKMSDDLRPIPEAVHSLAVAGAATLPNLSVLPGEGNMRQPTKTYVKIDWDLVVDTADRVNTKFLVLGIENQYDAFFDDALLFLGETYYWLAINRMLLTAHLIKNGELPGDFLIENQYVSEMDVSQAFDGAEGASPSVFTITTKGLAFFHCLFCDAMKAKMFYNPENFKAIK